jgi:hypothetical protein
VWKRPPAPGSLPLPSSLAESKSAREQATPPSPHQSAPTSPHARDLRAAVAIASVRQGPTRCSSGSVSTKPHTRINILFSRRRLPKAGLSPPLPKPRRHGRRRRTRGGGVSAAAAALRPRDAGERVSVPARPPSPPPPPARLPS